jgi:hypothetical protein
MEHADGALPFMTNTHPSDRSDTQPDTPMTGMQVYDRLRRWVLATDPRIVRRFWPAPADGGAPESIRPFCPVCGVTLRPGEPIQVAIQIPGGRASEALDAESLMTLLTDLPIAPGELWYTVCRPCLVDRPRALRDPWLTERLEALVEAALLDRLRTGESPRCREMRQRRRSISR